ncbi:MAG: hypothetical protein N3F09_05865 [Bacteroidia bacterium]|nr:hypothetical protein [Bacteroidia bacterium]
MKFSWYFENIENIKWYPAAGLILFMLLFMFILFHTYTKKEKDYQIQKQIPLDYEK